MALALLLSSHRSPSSAEPRASTVNRSTVTSPRRPSARTTARARWPSASGAMATTTVANTGRPLTGRPSTTSGESGGTRLWSSPSSGAGVVARCRWVVARLEAVAHAGFGEEVAGLAGSGSSLRRSGPCRRGGSRSRARSRSPDLLEQLALGDQPAGVADEVTDELPLGGGEADLARRWRQALAGRGRW